jgi:hypothetical protein
MNKDNLKVIALTQRIAEIVADYENKVADVRADYTLAVEDFQKKLADLESQNKLLKDANDSYLERLDGVVEEK